MIIVQDPSPRVCVKRLNFGQKTEAVLEKNNDLMFFMSHEAHFKLNKRINQQNCLKTINRAKT